MTAARISDAGMEQITPSSPNQTGSSERQPPKKQSGGTVKPVPPLVLVKKATTGYAGGHKEFHLWMKKENLRW